MNDLIALALFALFFSAAVGGGLVIRTVPGRRRWAGLALIAAGLGGAGLLVLMSSKYWFGDTTFFQAFIDVSLVTLAVMVAKVAGAAALAAAVALALGRWLRRAAGRRWWAALGCAVATVVALDAAGTAALVLRSRPPEAPSPVGRVIAALPGFSVDLLASAELKSPTALAFGPDGLLYVADIRGRVWRMPVDKGLGVAPALFADGFDEPLGLAWRGRTLYVASLGRITTLDDADGDGRAERRRDIVSGLPVRLFPLHQNNGIKFGPDGRLYFGLGAGHNAAAETNELTATILSVKPDGSDMQVFARGLRNAYGLAFNAAGDMFATENQPQGMPVIPGDELNHIERGKDYGYPNYFEQPPPGTGTVGPVYVFPQHASPDGIAFYEGKAFPADYRDNAFVVSWMRGEVYRVQLQKAPSGDYTARASIFASGFVNPLDVVGGPDGALYIADFGTSAVYRVRYAPGEPGQQPVKDSAAAPAP